MSRILPIPPSQQHHPAPAHQAQPGLTRRLLTLHDAATILGLSVASIRRLIASGRLPALRLVRHLRVDVRDVEALITDARRRGPWA
jgi:excisionase family DNA binding protein